MQSSRLRRTTHGGADEVPRVSRTDVHVRALRMPRCEKETGKHSAEERGRGEASDQLSRRAKYRASSRCRAQADDLSATRDQPHAAIDTECTVVAPFLGVAVLGALLGANASVHDRATLRAMPDGRVGTPMVQVVAGWLSQSSAHAVGPFCNSCRRELAFRPSASQIFSKLNGQTRSVLAT